MSKHLLIVATLTFLLIISGCSGKVYDPDHVPIEGNSIVVQKLSDDKKHYENIMTIEKRGRVEGIKKILTKVTWEKQNTDKSLLADYRIIISLKDSKCTGTPYAIIVSPNREYIEIIKEDGCNQSVDPYARLSEEDSATLFKLLTGEQLNNE
ncbi:hypothetical protein CIB95_05315 [Lottiidibacillus patelloidae]|uniref:Lipoprotein n=1 Tax=Lottiidibacillus patelloidae TaxID=2670334 RepID=A0A263BX76_9BACI|nr:hypothetical protein [Lottiidibacillus patelloidae]OZM57786.1 hypothetical protein CIB95_05315 [Lottiidibacillus patelloidae]